MRSARPEIRIVSFLFALMFLAVSVFASGEKPGNPTVTSELEGIKMRLAGIEKSQRDVLTQKDAILKEIDRVRVWSRHSGGTKQP